jgi:hypothetical protein
MAQMTFRCKSRRKELMNSAWLDRLLPRLRAKADEAGGPIPLARKVQLSRNYIQQFLKEPPIDPGISIFLKLCEAADVSPVYIITGFDIGPQVEGWIRLAKSLPEDDLGAVMQVARRLSRRREPGEG